jgi:WD40 repeat protein
MVGSANIFSSGVDFFAFLEDGNTFIAGNEHHGVGLYRTSDHVPLERHYECENVPPETPDGTGHCRAKAHIYDLGYIDANTWYFIERTLREIDMRVHVRTIHPPQEISASIIDDIPYNAIVSANRNYIADNNGLIDWRTGKRYPTKTHVLEPKWQTFPTLTPDNRIITYPKQKTVIFDPLNDTMEAWKSAARLGKLIVVTLDNRHAIGLSTANGKCTLWRWPERKIIGHCSPRLYGIFGKHSKYFEVLALSPDGKSFAVGDGNKAWVYRIEPFRLELEVNMPDSVSALALSNNGWLAISDRKGFFRVWDVNTGGLAGQRRFSGNGLNEKYVPKLAFQPDSNKLFTTYGGITVFEIPRQATK